ncbi:Serine/threonine-protein kinase [Drechslerella dactyloides]|uniref:non-specific serine/threonine protein kinase n=1 Tax=Drechslerella dactyloides TaxID=74499 RepID=A0AAD6J6F2_DREDA|nr:Serine/threonine-protein kinase [Drechslerella dactyloides]
MSATDTGTVTVTGSDDKMNMNMDVGTPYQFNHVTHVGFDHNTGGFVGLPPEWEQVLRGEITAEEVNARRNPPNYQRQAAMTNQRTNQRSMVVSSRRRKSPSSCLMSLLGRCFGQSSSEVDRPTSPSRVVSSSRLVEASDRPSSIPPPYDSVKSYDEAVSQRPMHSPRTVTPPTQ